MNFSNSIKQQTQTERGLALPGAGRSGVLIFAPAERPAA